MSANVGTIGRVLRALIGIVALALVFVGPIAAASGWGWGWERIALVAVGVIMLGTSMIKGGVGLMRTGLEHRGA